MAITFAHPKKLFLLDQDGTLYKGSYLFKHTKTFLESIIKSGASYLFITNNSSKSIDQYVQKMLNFGITTTKEMFYTSANATIDYLNENYKGFPVYLVGTAALVSEFQKAGINLTLSTEAKIAILSYDTELTYEKLTNITVLLRNKEVVYLATNPDLVCPTEDGYLPDCGSFAILIENATGRLPLYLGKPRPLFIETILHRYNLTPQDLVIVGDRLYTDIALGLNTGVDSVLVLSGETKASDLTDTSYLPTFVVNDIGDIF